MSDNICVLALRKIWVFLQVQYRHVQTLSRRNTHEKKDGWLIVKTHTRLWSEMWGSINRTEICFRRTRVGLSGCWRHCWHAAAGLALISTDSGLNALSRILSDLRGPSHGQMVTWTFSDLNTCSVRRLTCVICCHSFFPLLYCDDVKFVGRCCYQTTGMGRRAVDVIDVPVTALCFFATEQTRAI